MRGDPSSRSTSIQRASVPRVPRPQSISVQPDGVLDRIAMHVVELPRQRLRDAVHAAAEISDLRRPRLSHQGAVRSFATKAACVIGIRMAKSRSTASANFRISRCAVSALRSERKFIRARALSVQKNSV